LCSDIYQGRAAAKLSLGLLQQAREADDAVSGLRISWLMLAMKSVFAALACREFLGPAAAYQRFQLAAAHLNLAGRENR